MLSAYNQYAICTKLALVSSPTISLSDFMTYCGVKNTLLFREFQIPDIYCLYNVYGSLSAGNPLFWEQEAEPILIR